MIFGDRANVVRKTQNSNSMLELNRDQECVNRENRGYSLKAGNNKRMQISMRSFRIKVFTNITLTKHESPGSLP